MLALAVDMIATPTGGAVTVYQPDGGSVAVMDKSGEFEAGIDVDANGDGFVTP